MKDKPVKSIEILEVVYFDKLLGGIKQPLAAERPPPACGWFVVFGGNNIWNFGMINN